MGPQLGQRHRFANGSAVIQDVEVARLKIHDAFTGCILYIGVPDTPFFGDGPVENLGSRRHFRDLQWEYGFESRLTFAAVLRR